MAVEALKKDRKTSKKPRRTAKTAKKHNFSWQGADKKGNKVTGEMMGETPAMVKALLRKQGISPIKVNKKAEPLFGGGKGKPIDF